MDLRACDIHLYLAERKYYLHKNLHSKRLLHGFLSVHFFFPNLKRDEESHQITDVDGCRIANIQTSDLGRVQSAIREIHCTCVSNTFQSGVNIPKSRNFDVF